MAGVKPFFITGASAKIKIDGILMAFITDIEYTVTVKHAKPRVLGMYENLEVQPLSYDVSGSFTVVRYSKGLKSLLSDSTPQNVSDEGNSIGSWKKSSQLSIAGILGLPTSSEAASGKVNLAFDPGKLLYAMPFDIEIYQVVAGDQQCAFSRLRGCRVTSGSFKMAKKTLGMQTYTFEGTYLDEDGFFASLSGIGQHLE